MTEVVIVGPNPRRLTPKDKIILDRMIDPDARVDDLLPAGTDVQTLGHYIGICAKGFCQATEILERLKPVLGHLLLRMKNENGFIHLGFRDLEDYLKFIKDAYGVGRTTCFDCMQIVWAFPHITVQDYKTIGQTKLLEAVRSGVSGSGKTATEVLEKAKELPYRKFVEYLVESKLTTKGETTPATIVILCDQDTKDAWEEFIANSDVHAVVGTPHAGTILKAMMGECFSTWLGASKENAAEVEVSS
jgi:hypothetical protein